LTGRCQGLTPHYVSIVFFLQLKVFNSENFQGLTDCS